MKVYNTLSAQKEDFIPQGDEVRMYVCGVTPYDESHIGHAMSYIVFDAIRRYLKFRGYKVRYVQNITDIDDKIIDRANKIGMPARELAEKYAHSFFDDMDALNIGRADIYPRATREIPMIIKVIEGLIDRGHAYPAQGSVYFRVNSVSDYGKLSHRSLDSMMAGARIEAGEEKEHPMDFVLWKAAKPGEPSWDSPWGKGRPGWHIECSAMSLKYLGNTLDIHGGGQDLIFPHHENEIAQSEGFTGVKPFVRYWLHNGLLQLGEEKMSKSLGNLITIKEALERYSPDAIRIFVLSSHYRSPLTYSEAALEAAERGADRLRQTVRGESRGKEPATEMNAEPHREQFIEAMDDDFNTAQAVAILFDLAHDINRVSEAGWGVAKAKQVLVELSGVLGLNFEAPPIPPLDAKIVADSLQSILADIELNLGSIEQEIRSDVNSTYERAKRSADVVYELTRSSIDEDLEKAKLIGDIAIKEIIDLRQDLRASKLYELADEIRERLGIIGISLEDTPAGTVWKRKR